MNPAVYVGIFLPLLVIMLEQQQNYAQMTTNLIIKRKKKGLIRMNESVRQFIGKNCMVYTYNYQLVGNIVSVEDNWLTIKTKNANELVNLDYISRIREYPIKKQG